MSLNEKVDNAIKAIKMFSPEKISTSESYYVCYSGGKDSDCIRILCELAGVKYELHHNHTTMDAPETVQYIKSIPGVIREHSYFDDGRVKTIWNMIPYKKTPPTRIMRWCCSEFKEHGGFGRLKITGVRWAESASRAENADFIRITSKVKTTIKVLDELGLSYDVTKQGGVIMHFDNEMARDSVDFVHQCYNDRSTSINPIVDWSDHDVWDFLHYYGCSSNPLYARCSRVGCIGCPLSGYKQMRLDFLEYPKYKDNYIRAFDRMIKARKVAGLSSMASWVSGESVFRWWTEPDYNPDQLTLF